MGNNRFLRNKRGQVALILIFVAAIGLILYAMTMNLTKLSNVKLLTTIAGNMTASSLASRMASYGENVMQTQLGGQTEKCDYTSILSAIIGFIIVIIIIIICVVCHQFYGMEIGVWGYVALIAAAVLAAASIVIQVVYIQPMITKMWNKMQAQISTTEDMFLEGALQLGLQNSVTDQVKIRDFFDYDMDGRVAMPLGPYDPSSPDTWPTVPRFVFYYTERLKTYRNFSLVAANSFINAVSNLAMGLGIDTWSSARKNCCSEINPEFCDACCVVKDIRQQSCHPGMEKALFPDIPTQCASGPMPGYPLSYDSFFCNRLDSTTLPNLFGIDDGNIHLKKTDIFSTSSEQVADDDGGNIFRGEDSEGKLFPLLWMTRDGAAYVRALTSGAVSSSSRACHWCAPGPPSATTPTPPICDSATAKSTYRFWYYPLTKQPYGQLVLPHSCVGDGCCINRFNTDPYFVQAAAQLDSRRIDSVGDFTHTIGTTTYSNGLFEAHPPCGGVADCPASDGYWRAGSDDFCSTTAPYYMGTQASGLCTKWQGMAACLSGSFGSATDCDCSNSLNKCVWFNDPFDNFVFWLRSIASDIATLIAPNGVVSGSRQIADSFDTWRSNAEKILREFDGCTCACNGSGRCVNGACSGGAYDTLETWRVVFADWLNRSYSDESTPPDATPLWCLPSNSAYLPINEYNVVMDGGFTYGTIRTVLNCLKYNATMMVPRLQACKTYCDANPSGTDPAQCLNLPRSLLLPPGANGNPLYDLNAIYNAGVGGGCARVRTVTINGANVNLPFRDIITLSLRLAEDQAMKMEKRYEYLYNMYEYVRAMAEGLYKFEAVMTPMRYLPSPQRGPIQAIRDAICAIEEGKDKGRIENIVYYGWCTDWDTGDPKCAVSGRWHLARVEAWLPKRCEGYAQGCGPDRFPWVETEKSGCCKRCYFMQDHSGRVRARILRYDSPTASTMNNMLRFANGLPLWQFRLSNPYSGMTVEQNLYRCQLDSSVYQASVAPGAFILNGTADLAQKDGACQNAIHNALQQAVGNETCAYYYLSGNQYRIRFGRCDSAAASEVNWRH